MIAPRQAPQRLARRAVPVVALLAVSVALVVSSYATAPRPASTSSENLVAGGPGTTIAADAGGSPTLGFDPTAPAFGNATEPSPSTASVTMTDPPKVVAAATPKPTADPAANPAPKPTPKPTPKPMPPPPAGVHLALGVWTGQPWDSSALNGLKNMIGGAPAVYHTYANWDRPFYKSDEQAIANLGAAHVLTWEPRGSSGCYTLTCIANGNQDTFIRNWAKGAVGWGKTFYLRFMHEMNGDWYPWGRGVNGNTPTQFIAAWRHVHDIFKQEGATKVKWVWCPNVRYGHEYPLADLWPGSSYVDWTCLDGYNWGTDPHLGQPAWQSFKDIFGATYTQIRAISTKPMMIAETSSTEHGGSKADWIIKTFLTDIPKYSGIKCVLWFNQKDGIFDFRINSSSSSLNAFKQVYRSSTWSGNLYRG